MRKTFVGYDLGDGETITDRVTIEISDTAVKQKQNFPGMTMPGSNQPGLATPTTFAKLDGKLVFSNAILMASSSCKNIKINFKRRPTDLLPKMSEPRKAELLALFENSPKWPTAEDFPEGGSDEFHEFKSNVIEFTNAIFENEVDENGNDKPFYKALKSSAVDSDAIVFCVGHPTEWNDLDVAIYKAIFRESVIGQSSYAGKPTELIMGAESRAAFLYVKDQTDGKVIPKDTCVLLLDIGSSTIDLTAMSADSRNHVYNSGSNYLGARGIDFIIREWYLSELKNNQKEWDNYIDLLKQNPSIDQALTLACRKAKEEVYSNQLGLSKIDCEGLMTKRLEREKLNDLVAKVPFGKILNQEVPVPEDILSKMGEKS